MRSLDRAVENERLPIRRGDVVIARIAPIVQRRRRRFVSMSRAASEEDAVTTSAPACSSSAAVTSRFSPSSSTTSIEIPSSGVVSNSDESLGWAVPRNSSLSDGSTRTVSRGNRTVNVAPRPSPALSADTLPPWPSTTCLTIESPRPRPPCERVLDASAWRNGSKTFGRNAALIPRPVSRTTISTAFSCRLTWAWTVPPRGVNLTALVKRFHTTCCSRAGSPKNRARSLEVA